jgi:hypothetical protein
VTYRVPVSENWAAVLPVHESEDVENWYPEVYKWMEMKYSKRRLNLMFT